MSHWGPVFVFSNAQDHPSATFGVNVPQEDLRYIGGVTVARFDNRADAEWLREQLLANNTYLLDRDGWWRRVERCDGCGHLSMLNRIKSEDVGTEYERHTCILCQKLTGSASCPGCGETVEWHPGNVGWKTADDDGSCDHNEALR